VEPVVDDNASRTLASDHRELARARIATAAREVVARRGFSATVEEIAELSGVSPRTIYRHYQTHDQLIAATVRDMYLDGWIKDLNFNVGDFDAWIEELAVRIHRRSVEVIGAAFWDIHGPRASASEVLSQVDEMRREFRLRGMEILTTVAWHKAGGTGDPPPYLVHAFALNVSAFTTQSLTADYGQTPEEIGALTADILKMLLRQAADAQRVPRTQHDEPEPARHRSTDPHP
jgi:AcrR family transcriptional regulator